MLLVEMVMGCGGTYVCVGGDGVVALDGIGLSAGQDHGATHLGFGAVGDGCSFRGGLKCKRIRYISKNSRTGLLTKSRQINLTSSMTLQM